MQHFSESMSWDIYVKIAPNSNTPTPEEAMDQALNEEEAKEFSACLQPLGEGGGSAIPMAAVYLWAVK